jgi:hypothetical protein
MYRKFLLLLIGLITVIGSVSCSFALPILQDGDILEEPKDLNNWFGLYLIEGQKSILAPVEIVVKRYHHTAADEPKDIHDESKWTGRTLLVTPKTPEKYGLKITSNDEEQQLIVMLQSKALVPGIVSTAFPGNESFENRNTGDFSPLGEIGLSLNNESYRLSSQYNDCRVTLIRSGISSKGPSATYARQCIFNQPAPEMNSSCLYGWPRLIWAGDIDGDKELDLVFDRDSDSTYERKLFLSEKTEKDLIVKEAGSFWRPSGC